MTKAKPKPQSPIVRAPDLGPDSPINSRDAVPAMRTWTGAARRCLQSVRESWQLPMVYGTARDARIHAKNFHPWTGKENDVPYGAPVFSRRPGAGPDDAEHVFMCGGHDGTGRRIFWSVDVKHLGETDPIYIEFLVERWGHEILGWSGDLNGYDLNLPLSPNARKKNGRK